MQTKKFKLPFPEEGSVFDYRLDDKDLTKKYPPGECEDEDVFSKVTPTWIPWLDDAPAFQITAEMSFSDIIVPTIDTIRNSALIERLVVARKQVLCVGPTGSDLGLFGENKKIRKLAPFQHISRHKKP